MCQESSPEKGIPSFGDSEKRQPALPDWPDLVAGKNVPRVDEVGFGRLCGSPRESEQLGRRTQPAQRGEKASPEATSSFLKEPL